MTLREFEIELREMGLHPYLNWENGVAPRWIVALCESSRMDVVGRGVGPSLEDAVAAALSQARTRFADGGFPPMVQ